MGAIPFAEFSDRFLGLYEGPSKSPKTFMKMTQVLRLAHDLGADSTADLTIDLANRYVLKRSGAVCANTVRGELGYLRAAANYAYDEEWLERLPRWRRIWPRASKPVRKTLHSIEDVRQVLAYLENDSLRWIGARTYALASLLAHTGLRASEALHAWAEDLNLGACILIVDPRRRLKTEGSARAVPLCPDVVRVLRDWRPRTLSPWLFPESGRLKPWTTGGEAHRPSGRLAAAGLAVGVDGFTPQSLRHTFCTLGRRRWGIDRVRMRDILGHTTEATHEDHYLHGPEDLAELVGTVSRVSYRV